MNLTTAALCGRWVSETSWSFYYWQPAPKWRLHWWLAKPGNPAMSLHALEKTILVNSGKCSFFPPHRYIREFKKLRRQLQWQRHTKIELCVKFSLLRLFHVGHVVQNMRSALSLAWHEWCSCKGKEWKSERFTAASSHCRQNLKYENFSSSFGRLRQNIAPKSVPHVLHDYFSSFNESNHWFVALSLTLPGRRRR